MEPKELLLRCNVYPGQFSDEFAVSAEQADGERFSLFAPTHAVQAEEHPTRDRPVTGWLKVTLWDYQDDKALVRLPRESFEMGWFITARSDQFRQWPHVLESAQ